jgi:hypothetical protein
MVASRDAKPCDDPFGQQTCPKVGTLVHWRLAFGVGH